MKRGRYPRQSRPRRGGTPPGPLDVGQRIRDNAANRTGVVVDFACQYAHPKAAPVYNYLIRWEDGQVQAFTSAALDARYGLELVD